ncbi:TetR/AcrR family transcriptional regulator [Xanthomonas campestris pv. campestris]|nr:TetR/AcrR family transcriptional regulator [Xanthomonas campestris pv. campestris]WDJ63091.1 TetR/AcrR family transcriptional regulator [Xanthomonas campestris pv. campestris]WDJ67296.1 TetR/AcrR family transcriptional regulator [Xanthomonas campestris pv. campestris]
MEIHSGYQAADPLTMSPNVQPRPPRADAQRNKTHILEVASDAFAEEGINVSMDSIAKRAGVGPGTLYRHFPSREALLAALLETHHANIEQVRMAITAEEHDPGCALQRWIEALGTWMNAYEGLPEPLRAAWCQPSSVLRPTCQSMVEASSVFLQAAQRSGQARETLTGRDIFLAALAIAWAGAANGGADSGAQPVLQDVLRSGWSLST